jgi:hypothetical protein
MVRTFTATKNGYVEEDIRSAGWTGACPFLTDAQKTAALARAVVKQVDVSVTDGLVRLADEASPSSRYSTADSSGDFIKTTARYLGSWGRHSFWLDTNNVAATYEVEVWFDIEDA